MIQNKRHSSFYYTYIFKLLDTIPQKQKVSKKVKVLTVSNLFGDVIQKVHSKESISSSFIC